MVDSTLVFVDGENLATRYHQMIRSGRLAATDNIVIEDYFIWNQRVLDGFMWDIKRLSYYTSLVGDDDVIKSVIKNISDVKYTVKTGHFFDGLRGVGFTTATNQIMPFVRKRKSRSRKESICDVAITVDVMRACYRDHSQAIWLFSGDGDFTQLVSEVVHSGKRVVLSAFSSGLSPELRYVADEFFCLDDVFFINDIGRSEVVPDILTAQKEHGTEAPAGQVLEV